MEANTQRPEDVQSYHLKPLRARTGRMNFSVLSWVGWAGTEDNRWAHTTGGEGRDISYPGGSCTVLVVPFGSEVYSSYEEANIARRAIESSDREIVRGVHLDARHANVGG